MSRFPATVLASVLLAVGGISVLLVSLDEEGSSPQRTATGFAEAAAHQNFGRACSYMTREWASDLPVCTAGEAAKQVMGRENANGSWTFVLDFNVGIPTTLTVVEQPSGKWRITRIE